MDFQIKALEHMVLLNIPIGVKYNIRIFVIEWVDIE